MNELILLLKDIKDKWGAGTVNAILKKIDSYPIKWKGTLRRSVSYSQKDDLDGDITFNMADYGKFIDDGVNGTQVPRGSEYSFRGNYKGVAFHLTSWANSKGINRYAAARSIQRKGIKPRPFFNSVIESRVEGLGEAITDGMAEYMDKSITNINNEPTQ
jgi:hypothetical protein